MFTPDEIRLLRSSRQMKQSDIANKMGIKKQRYSQLENNKKLPDIRVMEIIKVLGYTKESARKYLNNIPPPGK